MMNLSENPIFPRLRVRIALGTLQRNARRIRDIVGVPLLFTLKKDAYGHGALPCARALEQESLACYFAVYLVHEGIALRQSGITTPILAFAVPETTEEIAAAIQHGVTLSVTHAGNVALVEQVARRMGQTARVHLKVDTGMGRVGYPAEEQAHTIAALQSCSAIDFEGVYSHLADSEENAELTRRQEQRFEALVASISPKPRLCHLANSGGALRSDCRLDMVRIGIALYGGTPLYPTEPVMTAFSRLAQVRWYGQGESISYGATFRCERRLRAGIVPGGYGDGILRSLSNRGSVLIRGKEAPICGRVCMDQVVVDLSAIPDAAEGDVALFFGQLDGIPYPVWKNAQAASTISYELTTLVGRLAVAREWME